MSAVEPSSAPRAPRPAAPPPDEPHSVLDWARETGGAARVVDDLEHLLRRRRHRRLQAVAAGATAIMILAVGWIWQPWQTRTAVASDGGVVVVLRPETRRLADGSVVELTAGADVTIDFSGAQRRVALQRGTAHFAVAKDTARPFVVTAEGVEVRAVGTAFAVEIGARAVDVLVTEGRVTLNVPASAATVLPLEVLDAGNHVAIASDGTRPHRSTLSVDELRERLAWRAPRLEFSGTPLARALALWNEHAAARQGARLVLAGPVPAGARISGVLRVDDPDSLLRLLEGEFGLVAERRDGEIRLRLR